MAASSATQQGTNPDTEVVFDFFNQVRLYKSGRIERTVVPNNHLPASLDPATGVDSKDVVVVPTTGVWVRLYLPPAAAGEKLPLVVYVHGGCFCIGSAATPFHHGYLNSLVASANVVGVSVEYRLAPEHLVPAAYDDTWAALQWVASHAGGAGPEKWLNESADFTRVFLAGESAGANIVHNMLMRAGEADGLVGGGLKVKGAALVHSHFWGVERLPSETVEDKGRMMSPEVLDAQWAVVCPAAKDNDDPRLNPLASGAPSLKKLACERVLVSVAGRDLLSGRGRAYYEALKRSGWGGEAEFEETKGEDHGFHFFAPDTEKAKKLMKRMVAFFNRK